MSPGSRHALAGAPTSLQVPPPVVAGAGSDAVVLSAVSKSYSGTAALDGVELSVARGQFVSLIGPSGCGKSTLLRIVAGLLLPDTGSVSLFGESPLAATERKHVGFVPQSPALLPWRSVLDNVRLPLQVNRRAEEHAGDRVPRDPAEVLETFGLGDFLAARPHQLSLGMQQRVAIARAFVFDPELLVMDEPFSALDELTREVQRQELTETWQSSGKTVLFVTHSVAEAVALSDAVVVMTARPGRVGAVVPVALPRPRPELVDTDAQFVEIEAHVRRELWAAWRSRG